MFYRKSRYLALLLASIFVLASCGNSNTTPPPATAGTSTTAATATATATATPTDTPTVEPVAKLERVLRLFCRETSSTFNPQRQDNWYDMHKLVMGNLYMRVVDKDTQWTKFVPELADGEPIKMDDTGLVWQIKIKPGFTFDDGYPIDAYAFEYSQKMLVDPLLLNRNENSFALEGMAAYHAGECEWEEVTGYKVLDQYTIELKYIEDEFPVDGALDVMDRYSWMGSSLVHPEMFEKCFNADRTENSYGTTPDKFVASGVYRIANFIDGQLMEYEKRGNNATQIDDLFTADRIIYRVTVDANADLMLYENGELDAAQANPKKYDEYPDLYYYNSAYTYGIFINPHSETNTVLQDVRFRYALYWGIDREKIVKAAYPTYDPIAYHYPPATRIKDVNDPNVKHPYRESEEAKAIRIDGHEVTKLGFDPDLAVEYFNAAYEANGNKPITIEVQYSDGGESPQIWAEAIQEGYQNLFGKDRLIIKLTAVPDQIALEALRRTAMDYEVVAARRVYEIVDGEPWNNTNWISDGHPFSYSTQYCTLTPDAQDEFTELFDKAYFGEWKFDQAGRNKCSALVEELLLNDCTFIPVYNDRNRMLISPWLTSLMPNGHFDLGPGYFFLEWDDELYAASVK